MRALRFHGQRDIRVEEIDEPKIEKGKIKIKPAFVGLCGTGMALGSGDNLHEYLGGANLIPTTPHPITGEKAPVTLGHEFSGTVEEVGEGVTSFKAGDRVCVQPIIYDGTCGACKANVPNCCYQGGFIGLSGWGGGLSDHIVVPQESVIPLPDAISLEYGALVEPIAVAWHAVDLSPFKKGDSVLILGGGPIGLAVLQVLKARGAEKVIVSEVAPKRKQFARDFGADFVIDPNQEDLVARVKELCDGQGANIAFDAAGVQAALAGAVLAVRARGTLCNIAVWEKPASINVNDLVFKERNYLGAACYVPGDFQAVMKAIESGQLKPGPMITAKIKLDEVDEKGFKALITDKDSHVKILVDMEN